MTTRIDVLTAAAVLCAMFEVLAEALTWRRATYVLKPLTTSLILAVAVTLPNPVSGSYQAAIALGLLFSLAGDVFLMLPSDRFVAGLASFLFAHLCYIAAFASQARSIPLLAGVLLLAWGALLMVRLWPRLGRLRAPVMLYAVVLLAMAWTAFAQGAEALTDRAAHAAIGAVLFVISDSVLAHERFVRTHRWGQPLVLSTYFAAQLLIALSVSATA